MDKYSTRAMQDELIDTNNMLEYLNGEQDFWLREAEIAAMRKSFDIDAHQRLQTSMANAAYYAQLIVEEETRQHEADEE